MPKYRIMVVDDEADVRSIICTTLRTHYEVVEAHDGLDALEKLNRAEPDFVLMDVMMPLMDGYQACEAIRKDPRFHDLPVMFLSALGTKDDIRKGYSSGANLYLTKPFEPARLLRNIQVFFDTTPPIQRQKKHSMEQLQKLESVMSGPRPSIHEAETVHDWTPLPADVAEEPVSQTAAAEQSAPIASPEPEVEETPFGAAAPEAEGIPPRVIIVDDDQEIVNLMTMLLSNRFEVAFASDGLQAIERIVRYQPDLIIVDIMLPKMSGFQLCQSLRANKTFSKTPILVCSAKCGDRDVAYARRVGANDFLAKPFGSGDLLDKLSGMMRQTAFAPRPKNLTIQAVLTEIGPKDAGSEAFHVESEVRRIEAAPPPGGDTDEAFKKFLKKEGNKDAFGKDDDAEDGGKDKKKWRFRFGFKKE